MRHAQGRFLASELDDVAPDGARFHVIPVGYEESVSYGGGTAAGPAAILAASDQLELWDGESVPADLGIHTAPAVDCCGGAEAVLARIEAATATALSHGGLPVLLGGEHTVTLGALRALHRQYGTFGVIQFDAHADLRDSYGGTPYSHAAVMRRAVADLGLPLFQIGVRALCREEVDCRAALGVGHLDAAALARHGIPDPLLPPDFPERIYVTFDVDGLDPSIMPATGTPVPGGLGWYDARRCLELVMAGRQVLGFDVVELAPMDGFHAADFAAARLVYDIMGLVQRLCR
ncbi:agmatinase [Nitratidesulfovibrio sp. HK-II]|uniref:agmatinase n=1 Tax=Nitratidesulfovibrio sp. HK-II TaxID=2009266 RepID=UPI000E2F6A4E|nr:agmatinase [Nitratidesulfovibrio sp. HK-II]GBO97855.1 agmatinase [Nitratidesulfovibrio sp. HK-II]